jgi:hypothetical protein
VPDIPTEDEVLRFIDTFSNWNRWGPEDERGTLNLISDENRRAAAALIRLGRSVSCCWDIDSPPMQRYMIQTGQGLGDADRLPAKGWANEDRLGTATDLISFKTHGFLITHLDALSHNFWDGHLYNGFPAELVSSQYGATRNAITAARDGIFTRAVLIDVPAHRGVPWLEPGEPVHRWDVEAILEDAGLDVGEGDAMLLRTGNGRRRLELGDEAVSLPGGRAGWHASCLPFFHERGISMIGADTGQEVVPTGYDILRRPINAVGIASMGLSTLDNANFEPLSAACAEHKTSEFALSIAPIPFVGATGSPVNPIALF